LGKKLPLRQVILISLFTGLIAISAFIRIPLPMIPFTLQTLMVTLSGVLLGKRLGLSSVLLYLALGLLGLPLFAQGGGLGYVMQPTFGYLLGFLPGAYISGLLAGNNKSPGYMRLLSAALCGMLMIYLFGLSYWYLLSHFILDTPMAFVPLLVSGFFLLIPGDILSLLVGAKLAQRLLPLLYQQIPGYERR